MYGIQRLFLYGPIFQETDQPPCPDGKETTTSCQLYKTQENVLEGTPNQNFLNIQKVVNIAEMSGKS